MQIGSIDLKPMPEHVWLSYNGDSTVIENEVFETALKFIHQMLYKPNVDTVNPDLIGDKFDCEDIY